MPVDAQEQEKAEASVDWTCIACRGQTACPYLVHLAKAWVIVNDGSIVQGCEERSLSAAEPAE